MKVDIRLGRGRGPMMRELTHWHIRRKKGVRWVEWFWKCDHSLAYDCGFSGMSEQCQEFNSVVSKLAALMPASR